jgi:hypothetical protein
LFPYSVVARLVERQLPLVCSRCSWERRVHNPTDLEHG